MVVVLGAVVAGCGSTPTRSGAPASYGGLPSWLPKSTVPVGRVVVASLAHPALGIEGDTVAVDLPGGDFRVTAVGPVVPAAGRFPVPSTSPCTFTVSFSKGTGSVPFSSGQFTIVDERGSVHHPRLQTQGSPASVGAQPVTVTISDVLPTGNGQLRWAPDGSHPVVSWDFDVEID